MPDNARVIEFFFEPGSLLNAPHAQAHYLAANYTWRANCCTGA